MGVAEVVIDEKGTRARFDLERSLAPERYYFYKGAERAVSRLKIVLRVRLIRFGR